VLYKDDAKRHIRVLYSFEWDTRPECQQYATPRILEQSDGSPDPFCLAQMDRVTNECDAAAGLDKRGGRLYVDCAIYGWSVYVGDPPHLP